VCKNASIFSWLSGQGFSLIFLVEWIMQAFSDSFNAPIVFSHNDLLSGNFMYNEDEGMHYLSWAGLFSF